MIAPPSDMPELTKPNTLPIWPGGAASLTITSRGVRLAPVISPPTNSTATVISWAIGTIPTHNRIAAAAVVRITTKGRCRSVRSATQPPSNTPQIPPTIQPVRAEEAAAIGIPLARCRIVISQDWIPAPAIDDTMKKAKNIITDRPSSRRVPENPGSARPTRLAPLINQDAALPQDRQHHRHAQKPNQCQRSAPAEEQSQSGRG